MPDASTQLTEQQIELLKNLIDFGKIAVPSLITLFAVVLGARVGYRFSLRRFKLEKRLEFINQQVTKFYSPLVGCRMRSRASSELRVELSRGCNSAWRKICEEQPKPFLDHEKHFEPFKKKLKMKIKDFQSTSYPYTTKWLIFSRRIFGLLRIVPKNFISHFVAMLNYGTGFTMMRYHLVY